MTNTKIILTVLILVPSIVGCDSQGTQGSEPDEEAPKVAIVSPTDGTEVTEPMDVRAEVSDNREVDKVIFIINGQDVATLNRGPYEYSWDPSEAAETYEELRGEYRLEVKAFDVEGNEGSAQVTVTVAPPKIPISMISKGDPDQNFQFIFEIDSSIFIERMVTTDEFQGYVQDTTLGSEYEQFDRITLPSENREFSCYEGDWTTKVHGETRDTFQIGFTIEFRRKVFRCN